MEIAANGKKRAAVAHRDALFLEPVRSAARS
jgi:hypothetical protein